MTLLDERPLSPAERDAINDEPRPGVWLENDGQGDGRLLDQVDTDYLIACELRLWFAPYDLDVIAIIGGITKLRLDTDDVAYAQRGGIHSDPLVRLLAFRAWGDRDRCFNRECSERGCERSIGHKGRHMSRYLNVYGEQVAEW